MSMQRHNRQHPCPVCGGHDAMPRGDGKRCTGMTGDAVIFCSRPEKAGRCEQALTTAEVCWKHRRQGECPCGVEHSPSTSLRYALRDTWGAVVAIHERVETPTGKSFFYHHPDGTKGLPVPAETLLYGLELLGEAPLSQGAIVVEGEKAADALRGLDLPQVVVGTVGANVVPDVAVLALLRGRDVWLWPDNDDPGRELMAKIAKLLPTDKVRTISWGEEPKDDAADLVARYPAKARELVLGLLSGRPINDGLLVRFSEVEARDVDWLWEPYLSRGYLSLLEGPWSVGKTFVLLAIAAGLSTGHSLPSDARQRAPERVLYLSTEDGIADMLVPRLRTMQADLNLITQPARRFLLDDAGLRYLDACLERERPSLVVFDPLFTYTDRRLDIQRSNHVRSLTEKLDERARKYRCSMVGVRHDSKGTESDLRTRGLGGVDWGAAAHSILRVALHPEQEGRMLILQTKNKSAPLASTQQFRIVPYEDGSAGLEWMGSCQVTLDDVQQGAVTKKAPVATDILRDIITRAGGEITTKEGFKEMGDAGFSPTQARAACHALGIKTPVRSASGAWMWRLHPKLDVLQGGASIPRWDTVYS